MNFKKKSPDFPPDLEKNSSGKLLVFNKKILISKT